MLDRVITLESLVKEKQPITIRYEFRQYDGSLGPTPSFKVRDWPPGAPQTRDWNPDEDS
ncbi:MAG: hypothetical protein Q9P01_22550 [Anaerolineae bacterium]|nr:hypothetical protein [Anaerolineae bacterium]